MSTLDGSRLDEIVRAEFRSTCAALVDPFPKVTGLQSLPPVSAANTLPPREHLVAGSLGFAGVGLRGCVKLAATPTVWEHVSPFDLGPGPHERALLCDMVCELCNVLLGRFRNALLRHGVHVDIATPTSTYDCFANLYRRNEQHRDWYTFQSTAEVMYVGLDITFDDDFASPGTKPTVEPNIADLVLF